MAEPKHWVRAPISVILAALILSACAAITVMIAGGMSPDPRGFAKFALLAGMMGALAWWCRHRGLDPRLDTAAAIVGFATLSLMLCGVVSNAGLRLGAPLIDAQLAAFDGALGFDVESTVRAMATDPRLIDALAEVYTASGIVVVILIAGALVLGAAERAWHLVATAITSMQVVAIVSAALPALGAFHHLGMGDLQGNGVPAGAGIYHMAAFDHFYRGGDPILRIEDLAGLVTFPSFHTVLALLTVQALAGTRLSWLGVLWGAAVIVSTIPIGGHYVVDLAGGFAVWAGTVLLVTRLSSPSG